MSLAETDSLRGAFLTAVPEARIHSDNPEEVDALGKRFEAYYASARPVSLQLITGNGGDTVTSAVQRMTSDYNVLRAAIEANIRAQEQAIDAAFHAARTLQLSATFGVAMIALLAVLALGALSVATTLAVTRPLEEMAAVAGRIAQGDLSVTIPPAGDDEVGHVLRSMNEMVAYLNEMAAVAQAVSLGDLTRNVAPRSESDQFGTALAVDGGRICRRCR